MSPPLHPDVEPLAFLLGTWVGEGSGTYPTIEPFTYLEATTIGHVGKPFLTFVQRTTAPDGPPMHTESGYLRPAGADRAELVIAHPTGVVEVADGTIDGTTVRFRSTSITCTPTAKEVTAIERDLVVDGHALRYELRMAAVGVPLTHHLAAELHRQD